jgi:uncharacterized membrane protein YidH (DUF202 family)
MFGSLIDYAKLSANSVTTRLVAGLAIAAPLLFAFGFGLAAIFIALANAYGDLAATIILTIAFVIIAIIAAIVMAALRRRQEVKKEEALARVRNSTAMTALMAANPAFLLGAGRMAVGLVRRAPLLTILPIAAGFVYAVSRSSSSEDDTATYH